jgi:anti-sigma regulatory factor (Ser/Thr protein kinase)
MPVEPTPVAAWGWLFPVANTTPYWARYHAGLFLQRCRASDDLTATAQLLVSELVTNACAAEAELPEPGSIWLSLRRFDGHLLVEVIDSSPGTPVLSSPEEDSEGGRGLLTVDSLSSEWGYFRHSGKKVVYCILPFPRTRKTEE